ncbi:SGNH/GDSL hydrolase family protein [Phocaeicola paurosaccharolyticus]|jgi:hypothetical protein|uniref:SGNH/GDSL hydrolase family protein n=1 Tax=Phocaeicola paurosaccharolyticus TaxID=732242 RepID=UPI002FE112A7
MKARIFFLSLLCLLTFNVTFAQSLKSVSILGDSYSTFEGFIPDGNSIWYWKTPNPSLTDVDKVTQTWWHKFVKENNFKLLVNDSYSGSTICNTGYNKEDYTDRSFITRMKRLGCPDVIFIFGATNDSWANSPIGDFKYSDWTKEDLYNFRPALSYLLSNMIDYYPNIKIYYILNDGLKEEINNSIKDICKHYEIPLIELNNIDKKNGHPSVVGMQQISEQLKSALFLN